MKKVILAITLMAALFGFMLPQNAEAINYGDFRSETLVGKAWQAFNENDIEAVLAYTNKCLELYAEQAADMQDSLKSYPAGSKDEIFGYWALNDIATALYVQGEAYRKANMNDEAKAAYKKLISKFSFGQAWDTNGWFWKPAEAAKEKLIMLETGKTYDFGDYSSSHLAAQAWKASNDGDLDAVLVYTDKVIELYEDKAKAMQATLTEFAWESKDKIFSYWALNDVGTAFFIRGESLKKAGRTSEATRAYKTLVEDYYYSQCWDPNGWFWKPAEAAQQALAELKNS